MTLDVDAGEGDSEERGDNEAREGVREAKRDISLHLQAEEILSYGLEAAIS